jgi:hypothetical protein
MHFEVAHNPKSHICSFFDLESLPFPKNKTTQFYFKLDFFYFALEHDHPHF